MIVHLLAYDILKVYVCVWLCLHCGYEINTYTRVFVLCDTVYVWVCDSVFVISCARVIAYADMRIMSCVPLNNKRLCVQGPPPHQARYKKGPHACPSFPGKGGILGCLSLDDFLEKLLKRGCLYQSPQI